MSVGHVSNIRSRKLLINTQKIFLGDFLISKKIREIYLFVYPIDNKIVYDNFFRKHPLKYFPDQTSRG